MSSPRIPYSNWSLIVPSCCPNNQDGMVTDAIELCVEANDTWLKGRSHNAADPLHAAGVTAAASSPPPVVIKTAAAATAASASTGPASRRKGRFQATARPEDPVARSVLTATSTRLRAP